MVEGDALRRLYASHHGGFTVAVAMTSSEKKDYPPKMPLCIPQLHRASFALGSIPDIIEILLCCLGKIRLRLCTAHDYAISCHSWHKCACFPRLYFFRDELALSCMQQIGAVGVSDLPEHLLTGSLAQRESSNSERGCLLCSRAAHKLVAYLTGTLHTCREP